MKVLYLSEDNPTDKFMNYSLKKNENYDVLPISWTWEKYERVENNIFWLFHKYDILQNNLSQEQKFEMNKESILEGARDLYYDYIDDDEIVIIINEAVKDSIDFFCEFLRICKSKKFHIIYFYFSEEQYSYKEKDTDKYNPFEKVDFLSNKFVSLYLFDLADIMDNVVYNKNSLRYNGYSFLAPYFEDVDSEYSYSTINEKIIAHRIQELVFEIMKLLFEEIISLDTVSNIYLGQYILSNRCRFYDNVKNHYNRFYSSREQGQYHSIHERDFSKYKNMDFLFYLMANANNSYSKLHYSRNINK